jgi:hypothetical protein
MGSAAAQHPPKAFNDVELGAIARQSIQAQMRIGRPNLLYPCPTMPGRILDGDDDLGIEACRVCPGNIPQMHGKGRLEPLLFTPPGLRLAVGGLVKQARRSLPRHQIERGKTVDEVLVIPCPHQGPLALHPQGRAQRRHQRKPCFVLA